MHLHISQVQKTQPEAPNCADIGELVQQTGDQLVLLVALRALAKTDLAGAGRPSCHMRELFAFGRRFRVLNVVDDVTRECLLATSDTSIPVRRMLRKLTALIERRGEPGMSVSDNGTKLTSNATLKWWAVHKIEWYHGAPGKPMQNGSVGSFNGRMRDTFFDGTLFCNLAHARALIAARVTDDSTMLPHSALDPYSP